MTSVVVMLRSAAMKDLNAEKNGFTNFSSAHRVLRTLCVLRMTGRGT